MLCKSVHTQHGSAECPTIRGAVCFPLLLRLNPSWPSLQLHRDVWTFKDAVCTVSRLKGNCVVAFTEHTRYVHVSEFQRPAETRCSTMNLLETQQLLVFFEISFIQLATLVGGGVWINYRFLHLQTSNFTKYNEYWLSDCHYQGKWKSSSRTNPNLNAECQAGG